MLPVCISLIFTSPVLFCNSPPLLFSQNQFVDFHLDLFVSSNEGSSWSSSSEIIKDFSRRYSLPSFSSKRVVDLLTLRKCICSFCLPFFLLWHLNQPILESRPRSAVDHLKPGSTCVRFCANKGVKVAGKNEEEEFNTGSLSVLMMSVKSNTQVFVLIKGWNYMSCNICKRKLKTRQQVVGWPPVRSFRKNFMSVQKNNNRYQEKSMSNATFVKVSMDGAPYLRKVDLKMHKSYQDRSVGKMFGSFTIGNCGTQGMKDFMNESKLMDLLNGTEYVPTYEDNDGIQAKNMAEGIYNIATRRFEAMIQLCL